MRRRAWLLGSMGVVLAAALGCWRVSKATTWQLCGDLVSSVPTTEKVVALTFDDGPVPGHVSAVLEQLAAKNAHATFFLAGDAIEADRADAVSILFAGHELGNHSYSHQRMIFRGDDFIHREVDDTDRLIRGLGQGGEILFRPPYGKKLIGLPLYLASHHRRTVMWSVDAEGDASGGTDPASIADHVTANVRPGSIVLFHVLLAPREAQRQALPVVLERLSAAGYRFVTVSELIALGQEPPLKNPTP